MHWTKKEPPNQVLSYEQVKLSEQRNAKKAYDNYVSTHSQNSGTIIRNSMNVPLQEGLTTITEAHLHKILTQYLGKLNECSNAGKDYYRHKGTFIKFQHYIITAQWKL